MSITLSQGVWFLLFMVFLATNENYEKQKKTREKLELVGFFFGIFLKNHLKIKINYRISF